MNDFLHWIKIYSHDLINKITCVIMSIDSMDGTFKTIVNNEEIKELMEDINIFFIGQLNTQLSTTEKTIYKNSIIYFIKNKWSCCLNTDDMYFCCRLLYLFQLVFINEYNEEFIQEYIDLLNIKTETKSQWKYSLYLVALCGIDNNNSDNVIQIDNHKLFFSREIHLENNIISAFVDNVMQKQVVFERKFISVY
jgi:hypothetical protein